ncbi:dockerin type I repeat protein [Ruminiclostridium sufflavum DSM 19573]|uniref:cellulase n=1 Tax=Ruminiclostridium sufflavum DSM 19573 TaxID=1121337 RepID=A0A318XX73_9FIRM|nr:dockerin type I domain-containing protein [Ruminiclostridium sufflavum]PYG87376.1 dockerin type I repeat protein [Ruminiclostridium sufflavum DSM 19573]
MLKSAASGFSIEKLNKICLCLVMTFTIVLFSSGSIAAGTAPLKYGDVNGDGIVDSLDYALYKKYLLNTVSEFPAGNNIDCADVNGDKSADALDFALLKAYLLGLITEFPAESMNNESTPWDWNGIIGTGQSLSVGCEANPAITVAQPYNNLKISLEGEMVPPWDDTNSKFRMIPLIEPVRVYGYYQGGPYPGNIFGETPHTAMANQITSLVRAASGKDFVSVHTAVGESGQGIDALSKGAAATGYSGHAYEATLFEVKAVRRLAQQAGRTYGIGAIILTHGEKDSGNTNYENEIHKLWSDYNQDLSAITGQTKKIPLFLVQQHSSGTSGTSASLLQQWRIGLDYPGEIICAGPDYQNSYVSDGVHLTAKGYQQLGELYGKVYYERVVLEHDWQPLQPISAEKSGKVITVNFNVPSGPLVWDTDLPEPNQSTLTEWKNGKGFEVTAANKRIIISSVAISGSSVKITCGGDIETTDLKVGYAFTAGGAKRNEGTYRWGLLRDSDKYIGSSSGNIIPNYCVSFEMAVR